MDKGNIESLLSQGQTVDQMANSLGISASGLRYWMKKYGLRAYFSDKKKRLWTDDQMRAALQTSETISDVLKKLRLTVRPGNYSTVHNFVQQHNISISHMTGKKCGRGNRNISGPLESVLVKNSTYSRAALKRRLIRDGILEQKCDICGQLPVWHGHPLIMILDHVNGVNNDNCLSNLRLLCPNCNSQQSTFCGSNRKVQHRCSDCGAEVSRCAFRCKSCDEKLAITRSPRKVTRPSCEELQRMLQTSSWVSIAKQYGVSDNSVRKWAKRYNLDVAPRRAAKGQTLKRLAPLSSLTTEYA